MAKTLLTGSRASAESKKKLRVLLNKAQAIGASPKTGAALTGTRIHNKMTKSDVTEMTGFLNKYISKKKEDQYYEKHGKH